MLASCRNKENFQAAIATKQIINDGARKLLLDKMIDYHTNYVDCFLLMKI